MLCPKETHSFTFFTDGSTMAEHHGITRVSQFEMWFREPPSGHLVNLNLPLPPPG